MRRYVQLLMLAVITVFASRSAQACEEYRALQNSEIKEFRDKLLEPDADPLDRLFAFEELSCSDRPTIRNYAIREGLKNATDPIVRHQILFEALMQKTRIDVELSKASGLKNGDKEFYDEYSGVYSRNVTFRDRSQGCIGISRRACNSEDAIFIKGDVVEYNRGYITGVFKLTAQNELVGYLKPADHPKYSKIPAIIRLF